MQRWLPGFTCFLLTVSCGGDGPQPEAITFQFGMLGDATGAQDFRALSSDPAVIAEARAQLGLPLEARHLFINGAIDRGDGGHNLEWNWHFVPDEWGFAEFSIELCDGNAEMVSQAVDYWVDTVGQFCPWGARVTGEIDGGG